MVEVQTQNSKWSLYCEDVLQWLFSTTIVSKRPSFKYALILWLTESLVIEREDLTPLILKITVEFNPETF